MAEEFDCMTRVAGLLYGLNISLPPAAASEARKEKSVNQIKRIREQ
jgi:hypothetical protein